MKKFFSIMATVLILASGLAGCGDKQQSNSIKDKTQSIVNKGKDDVVDFPKNLTNDIGSGKLFVSDKSASSTTDSGKVPVIYTNKNDKSGEVELNSSGLNSENTSYIFIDGIYNSKKHLSGKSNIKLKADEIKTGKHKVDIVQFANNKTSDKVITHKTAYYEIQSK